MTHKKKTENYLAEANAAAQKGDWQRAALLLTQALEGSPQDAGILTGLGTCLIQLGKPLEAAPRFEQAAQLLPDSADAHNNLGVVYALAGRMQAAAQAYERAVALAPDHVQAWKNLAVVYLRQERLAEGVQILASLVQSSPQDWEAAYLLGQCYEAGEDADSARAMYQRALQAQPDNEALAQALQRLPAPAAAQHIARPEHASKLAALKGLKAMPKAEQPPPAAQPAGDLSALTLRAAFFGPAEAASETRLGAPLYALAGRGARVKAGLRLTEDDLNGYDVFIFANPHLSPDLIAAMETCRAAGKRVVVDLDRDFARLPEDHPDYARSGAGNPAALQALQQALNLANRLVVPTEALAQAYSGDGRRVAVIPYSWTPANAMWDKPAWPRRTFNLGMVGMHTTPADAALIKGDLKRFLKEAPNALLVFAADLELYQAFGDIPDERKLYIPPGRIEDYPYLLAQLDVLLLPLRQNDYTLTRADLPLLEAGARRLPWIASPAPAFKAWGAGGVFAGEQDGWFQAISRLFASASLRASLGEAGRTRADERSGERLAGAWLDVLAA
ncbi:MAG: tetratricopeptide repeat protein [Chloroflexi bacterium]|nr:tetratricopeptide repeat protein [Chloroflexota bacterium]